ncbi:MAG: HNH endonuclease, partial [Minisyncoccia bacterium]
MLRNRKICELPGFENYPDYLIDIEGNVYSLKNNKVKKLTPGWSKHRDWLLKIRIVNKQGKQKGFYIHKLVALAFIPTDNYDLSVTHINGNVQDNRVENLEWDNAERRLKKKLKYEGFIMTEELSDKINK